MGLNVKELGEIANILRRDSIIATTVAKSGHPTSCMSCAEIMSVLFFNEMKFDVRSANNLDNDEFIMSKGHAAPIYYSALKRSGCIMDDLKGLRKFRSKLEGHPMPRSLEWVKVATGSLGQGLSNGLGFALAAKLNGRKYRTYVLLGDSESAEGSVWEALELGSYYNLNNIVAIFDVNRLGETRETLLGHDLRSFAARVSGFGWNVVIIDGHDINQILNALDLARKSGRPFAILAKTFKGKGVSFLEDKEGRHGKALDEEETKKAMSEIPNPKMPRFKIKNPKEIKIKVKIGKLFGTDYEFGDMVATRDAFGRALYNLAKSDSRVVAVDAELSDSTRSENIKKVDKNRSIEVFIAEQNMIGISLGLAKKGLIPFASTFSTFFTRAHDQLRMASHSYNKDYSMVCVGSHAGVSVGEDGASQMGLEDISLFRSLANSSVLYPCDSVSAEKLTFEAKKLNGIIYIRTTRPKTPVIYSKDVSFPVGEFKILKESSEDKAVIIGAGITVHEALKAYDILSKKGKKVSVIDLYSIKPLEEIKLVRFVKNHGNKVVVVEDHYKQGGIGEMISSILINENVKLKSLFVKGSPHSGKQEELLNKYGINNKAIVKAVNEL